MSVREIYLGDGLYGVREVDRAAAKRSGGQAMKRANPILLYGLSAQEALARASRELEAAMDRVTEIGRLLESKPACAELIADAKRQTEIALYQVGLLVKAVPT